MDIFSNNVLLFDQKALTIPSRGRNEQCRGINQDRVSQRRSSRQNEMEYSYFILEDLTRDIVNPE